jgi:LuxR family transcriptional regulator, maltose regulon positive regulatory protein
MEYSSITPSKVIIPRRRNELVTRPRLLKWFDDLTDYKLFIVAAPAGYGKTSLLIDFAHSTQLPICWYSLDADDQDPQHFFAHLIRSIKNRFDQFGQQSLSVLQSMPVNKFDPGTMKSIIVNELYEKISEHFVIILDDVHLVEKSKPINDFLNDFVQVVDENCHLITASRTLLNLGDMPLFVAHSQVNGISFAELAFDAEEIKELFKQDYALDISLEEAEKLAQDTEGWITGLLLSTQISGMGVRDQLRIARISGVGLYEYLAQQVFNQQPQFIQKALLRTSLFDEFDAEICSAVIDKALGISDNWNPILENILGRNLFVLPVGEEQLHIRYHHLFRDFLRNKMITNFPFETEKISLALAEYDQSISEWEKAYQIYSELKRQDRIVNLIQLSSTDLFKKGRIDLLSKWIDNLPNTIIDQSAGLLSIKGAVLSTNNDLDGGVNALEKASQLLIGMDDKFLAVQTFNRLATTYRMKGLYQKSIQTLEKVFRITHDNSGMANLEADSFFILGVTQYFAGEPDESLLSMQRALDSYVELKDFNTSYKVESQIATVLRNLGKYSQSEQAYSKALEYCTKLGNIFWQATILNSLGILQQLLGEYDKSIKTFEKALDYANITSSQREKAYTLASIGDLYVEIGAIAEAKEAYHQSQLLIQQFDDQYLIHYINLANIVCQRIVGDLASALKNSNELLKNAIDSQSLLEINHTHLERGIILVQLGEFAQARDELESSFLFFKNSGYKLESVKTSLVLIIAYFQMGETQKGRGLLNEFTNSLENSEYEKMSISAAFQVRTPLMRALRKAEEKKELEVISEKLGSFQKSLVHLRANLRPSAVSIPITPTLLSVKCFGRVEIRINNEIVPTGSWQAQVARDMFLYLLLFPRGGTKEQLGEIFWPGSNQVELKLRFKNAMYRLRRVVGGTMIQFKDNFYSFNRKIEHDVDALIFRAEVAEGEKSKDSESRIEHFENALNVYLGDFLPDIDLEWAGSEREVLAEKFVQIAWEIARFRYQTKQYESAEELCQRILDKEAFQEDALILMMKILGKRKDKKAIKRHFEKYKKKVEHSPNLHVSKEIASLYEVLTK